MPVPIIYKWEGLGKEMVNYSIKNLINMILGVSWTTRMTDEEELIPLNCGASLNYCINNIQLE